MCQMGAISVIVYVCVALLCLCSCFEDAPRNIKALIKQPKNILVKWAFMPDKEKSEKRWDNNEAEAISDLMIVILLVSVSLSANSSTKGLHKSILRQHSYIGRQCCV